MKHIKFRTWVLILLVLLISMTGLTAAKYINTKTLDGTVTFTAELAQEFYLLEHVANRQDDGSYQLSDTKYVKSNQQYILIPGLDIPKDPHIVINGKSTHIPAYLFLEVVDNMIVDTDENKLLEYDLESFWIPTELKTSDRGGTFYVYGNPGTKEPIEIKESHTKSNPIRILQNNEITVSQKLLSGVNTGSLTFYAYLEEASLYKNP